MIARRGREGCVKFFLEWLGRPPKGMIVTTYLNEVWKLVI